MAWTSELALTNELIEKINDGKEVVYIPKFTEIKQDTDFNFLADVLERHELGSEYKNPEFRPHFPGGVLSGQIQVRKVEKDLFFETYFKIFNEHFNKEKKYSDIHLHLSFMALSGASHRDWEHVFIMGLYGHTIYRVYGDKDYHIQKGDFIYIPPNKCHKAIAMGPRIIMSMGIEK